MKKSTNLQKACLLAGRLCKLVFVNRRGLREISGVALSMSEDFVDPEIDILPIPAVSGVDLIANEPNAKAVQVVPFRKETFSITLAEALGLALLARRCNARRIFEFGTHRGISTSQLAANLPEDGVVITLDLPRNDKTRKFEINDSAEMEVANFPKKADLIPESLRAKVTFLEQDSALFDPAPYRNSIDFIFVDAAHTAEYVQNDSEKAWEMLRPGGIVAWHDCRPQSQDVARYLRQCPYQPRRIAGTSLAFATKPSP